MALSSHYPLEKLDFSYIKKCTDSSELEEMYNILRAGTYGYFPKLAESCETQLRKVDPNNEALYKYPEDIVKALPDDGRTADFNQWINSFSRKQGDNADIPETPVTPSTNKPIFESLNNDIPIRTKKTIDINQEREKPKKKEPTDKTNTSDKVYTDQISDKLNSEILNLKPKNPPKKSKKDKPKLDKINGFDFRSWDKYDVDKACDDMDDSEDEENQPKIREIVENKTESTKNKSPTPPKNKSPKTSKPSTPTSESTHDRIELSERFKLRGTELFKQQNYADALRAYTQSVDMNPKNFAALNNRALCNLKLKNFESAIKDTTKILVHDEINVKALLRRCQASIGLKTFQDAKKDVETLKELDRKSGSVVSKDVLKMSQEIEAGLKEAGYKKRLVIESDSDDSESEEEIVKKELPKKVSEIPRPVKTKSVETKPVKTEQVKTEPVKTEPVKTEKLEKQKVPEQKPVEKTITKSPSYSEKLQKSTAQKPSKTTEKSSVPTKKPQNQIKTETLKSVNTKKTSAGEQFLLGQYNTAMLKYKSCLSDLESLHSNTDPKISTLRVNLHNNIAQCLIQSGQHSAAIRELNIILNELDATNEKARLRRAKCFEEIDAVMPAWHDFRTILNVHPNNLTARGGIDRVQSILQEKYGGEWRKKVNEFGDSKRRASGEKDVEIAEDCGVDVEKVPKIDVGSVVNNDFEEMNKDFEQRSSPKTPNGKRSINLTKLEDSDTEEDIPVLEAPIETVPKSPRIIESPRIVEAKTETKRVLKPVLKSVVTKPVKKKQPEMKPVKTKPVETKEVKTKAAEPKTVNKTPVLPTKTLKSEPELPEITKKDIEAPQFEHPDVNEYDSNLFGFAFFSGFNIKNKTIDNWNLLRKVEPKRIPSMMSANLDGDILLAVVLCVKSYYHQSGSVIPSAQIAFDYLHCLAQTDRFDMNLAFLEEEELDQIHDFIKSLCMPCSLRKTPGTHDMESLMELYDVE